MNKKTLTLHIGMGKTGTSAIQECCYDNREKLGKLGVSYPEIGLYGSSHPLLTAFQGDKDTLLNVKNCLASIATLETLKKHGLILISTENLSYPAPEVITSYKEIFADYDFRIVFFMRNHVDLVRSTYSQHIVAGSHVVHTAGNAIKTIEEFFSFYKDSLDYMKIITPWHDAFGIDALKVRLYDRRIKKGLWPRFSEAAGLPVSCNNFQLPRKNESVSPVFFPLLNLFHKGKNSLALIESFASELSSLSNTLKGLPLQDLISEKFKSEIIDYYRESDHIFAKTYMEPNEQAIFLN